MASRISISLLPLRLEGARPTCDDGREPETRRFPRLGHPRESNVVCWHGYGAQIDPLQVVERAWRVGPPCLADDALVYVVLPCLTERSNGVFSRISTARHWHHNVTPLALFKTTQLLVRRP